MVSAPSPAAGGQENEVLQLFGETWQWTNSAYLPYPGFKILLTAPWENTTESL